MDQRIINRERPRYVTAIIQYLFLYLMFITHGSVIYNINEQPLSYFIIAVCCVFILIRKGMYRNYYVLHAAILMAFMFLLSLMHSQPYFMKVAIRIVESLLLVVVTYKIDTKNFICRFVKLTLFFAVVSLFFYFIQLLNPKILETILFKQPDVVGWEEADFYGKWLYTYRGIYALHRNNGIFTEPGLYQMLINASLAVLLFFPQLVPFRKIQHSTSVTILVITLVTTSSTTGYIGLLIIIIAYFLKRNRLKYDKGVKRYAYLMLTTVVIASLLDYYIRAENSILYLNVIEKFEQIGILDNASGGARLSVIEICIGLFSLSPIRLLYGFGYSAVSSAIALAGVNTAGAFVFYFLAAAGLPITIYLLFPYLFKTLKYKNRLIESIVFILLYFNSSLAQSREAYPALLLLPFILVEMSKLEEEKIQLTSD